MTSADPSRRVSAARINEGAGVVVTLGDTVTSIMSLAIAHGRIIAMYTLGDPRRLSQLGH